MLENEKAFFLNKIYIMKVEKRGDYVHTNSNGGKINIWIVIHSNKL